MIDHFAWSLYAWRENIQPFFLLVQQPVELLVESIGELAMLMEPLIGNPHFLIRSVFGGSFGDGRREPNLVGVAIDHIANVKINSPLVVKGASGVLSEDELGSRFGLGGCFEVVVLYGGG
jgi:hypothetical protein